MFKMIKDEKGSGSIEVAIAVILLVFIFFSTLPPIVSAYKSNVLEVTKMKALDAMQINGGMNGQIKSAVISYLSRHGFDASRITIHATNAPVNWGEEIAIEIRYSDTLTRYRRNGLLSFERYDDPIEYVKFGATTSYYYNNN